jgi:hypothetical protein
VFDFALFCGVVFWDLFFNFVVGMSYRVIHILWLEKYEYDQVYTEQQEYVLPAMGFPTQPVPSWYVHTLSGKK